MGLFKNVEEAIAAADALREATMPGCPRYGNNDGGSTTTHDTDTNSTTTVDGNRYGSTGGTVGNVNYNF